MGIRRTGVGKGVLLISGICAFLYLIGFSQKVIPNAYLLRSGDRQAVTKTSVDLTEEDYVIRRFHWAMAYIRNVVEPSNFTIYQATHCPELHRIGTRPSVHGMPFMGTTCEPWMVRSSVILLHELLLPGTAKALEWSSGSSTGWLLRGHVSYLYSIENSIEWVNALKKQLTSIFGEEYLKAHWSSHHLPQDPSDTDPFSENAASYRAYTAAAFLEKPELGTFDFISIDGRARVACFPRALELLKPHGGILVLDNADRGHYQAGIDLVPKHWLRYDALYRPQDITIVWVSCFEGNCGPFAL